MALKVTLHHRNTQLDNNKFKGTICRILIKQFKKYKNNSSDVVSKTNKHQHSQGSLASCTANQANKLTVSTVMGG